MHISQINPYIRLAMHSVLSGGFNIKRRVIYDYELICLERGSFTLIYDDIPYRCSEGDIIFIRPGVPHSFRLDSGDISQPHIHFDLTVRPESERIPVSYKDIGDMTDEERGWIHRNDFSGYPSRPFVVIQNRELFLHIFYQILSEKTLPLMKKGLLIQLLSMLIGDNFPDLMKARSGCPIAGQLKDYMDAGNGFGMSLDDFAKNFFHSKFYLEKKFRQAFGVGLIEYRNNIRMERANHLLATRSVSEVAEELGFQSIYSFSRAYKKHCGMAPSRYRNRCLARTRKK